MNKILMSKDKKTIKEIILYLLNSLGSNIEGKKKIMKLMFLLEYYDFEKDKITSTTVNRGCSRSTFEDNFFHMK